MSAVAHMIFGYLGAGKTTFAKALEARLRGVRFSPDERMVERHGTDPPADRFGEYLEQIYVELNAEWPRMLSSGRDVVLDFGFWTRASRDSARHLARQAGAEPRLYWLRCADATALRRCQARNQKLSGSLHISDNTFELLKARFESLAPDEPFELVDTDLG